MGMRITNVEGANGTWLEGEEFCYAGGGLCRRARVECEDGKLRVVRCSIPDTYFSIPAVATIKGKAVKGFVSSKDVGDDDRALFTFTPTSSRGRRGIGRPRGRTSVDAPTVQPSRGERKRRREKELRG
jgi:hypothetical protein